MVTSTSSSLTIMRVLLPLLLQLTTTITIGSSSGCRGDGCVCADKIIICTCVDHLRDSGTDRSLVLPRFGDAIEFISKVIIHSCDRVTIPQAAFAKLAIDIELRIVNVHQVTIEPGAFREMIASPRQIIIRDAHLGSIRADTFAGLVHVDHIWFRNVTIGTIESYAFRHVTDVDYLYFRESKIQTIETRAFANLDHVKHLFIRGRVHINDMASMVFAESHIDEIIFDDVHIGNMSSKMWIGINATELHIINTTIDHTTIDTEIHNADQSLSRLYMHRTTIDKLAFGTMSHFSHVELDHCHIHSLIAAEPAQIGDVHLIGGRITTIDAFAFANATIDQLTFDGGIHLRTISTDAFADVHAQTLTIRHVHLHRVHRRAFTSAHFERLTIVDTSIYTVDDFAFESMHIADSMNITQCRFMNAPRDRMLAGALATRLVFDTNLFPCECYQSSILAMIFNKVRHIGAYPWTFSDNLCTNDNSTSECAHPITTTTSMVQCHQSGQIIECVCTSPQLPVTLTLADPSIAIVSIGDCDHLTIESLPSSTIALVVYRVGKLHLSATTIARLRSLFVIHSSLAPFNIVDADLSTVHIVSSRVDSFAISGLTLSQLIFDHCDIVQIGTFHNTSIDLCVIGNSQLYVIDADSFVGARIANLSLISNRIYGNVDALLAVGHRLCFQSNQLNCDRCADKSAFRKLISIDNQCLISSNRCRMKMNNGTRSMVNIDEYLKNDDNEQCFADKQQQLQSSTTSKYSIRTILLLLMIFLYKS